MGAIRGRDWTRFDTPGYVRAWRATANGLEGAAAAALYSLSNGSGKQRAGRGGELREGKSWRVLVLSSGEIPTESKLSEDRTKKPRAGQLVRLLDIEVDRGFGFGAFDNGGPDNDAGQLAQRFKREATAACGMAGPEFVRMLIDDDTTGSDIRAFVDEFVSGCLRSGADGQVERAARRFGLIAAAGEFAIAFGLVPWPGGSATDAAAWALRQWVERRGGTAPAEDRQAIEQVIPTAGSGDSLGIPFPTWL